MKSFFSSLLIWVNETLISLGESVFLISTSSLCDGDFEKFIGEKDLIFKLTSNFSECFIFSSVKGLLKWLLKWLLKCLLLFVEGTYRDYKDPGRRIIQKLSNVTSNSSRY